MFSSSSVSTSGDIFQLQQLYFLVAHKILNIVAHLTGSSFLTALLWLGVITDSHSLRETSHSRCSLGLEGLRGGFFLTLPFFHLFCPNDWFLMDGAASRKHGSTCWAQWLSLALLSDTSNSGQSLELVSGVSRVPSDGSSSNLLWVVLSALFSLFLLLGLWPFWFACRLNSQDDSSYWESGGNFEYLFHREKFLLFSSALPCTDWVVALP